jgi:hypothetical protein
VLQIAYLWGYKSYHLSWKQRQRIAKAACRLVAYDCAFQQSLAASPVPAWDKCLQNSLQTGEDTDKAVSPRHAGSTSYITRIKSSYPGYLRELWRYAIKTKGSGASFQELADTMNEKSAAPAEERVELSISTGQLSAWFTLNNGKQRSSKEKPMLTQAMKASRLAWVDRHGCRLTTPNEPVAFLDEKWFYKRNRRRKLKDLPLDPNLEPAGADKLFFPKATSRRFPVKVMYMGVVGRPNLEQNFDGKILLLRVSRPKQLSRATGSERFVSDATMNGLLKEGGWRSCYVGGMTVGELRATVVESYDMEDDVADHLCFGYETHVGTQGNTQKKWLDDDDVIEEVEYRPTADNDTALLGIDCVEMQVRHEAGEWVEEDVNCDSQFMLDNIRKIGQTMRDKISWVPHPQKCYLVMDNAGGHGTEEAIKKYTDILETEFDIEIIHQIPRSPETNILDLGIWCSLQWAVDKLMRGRRGDMEALVQGVTSVWNGAGGELSTAFSSVWTQLTRVLHLIKVDEGGNESVEKKRGKRLVALDKPLAPPTAAGPSSAAVGDAGDISNLTTVGATDSLQAVLDVLEDDDEDELYL